MFPEVVVGRDAMVTASLNVESDQIKSSPRALLRLEQVVRHLKVVTYDYNYPPSRTSGSSPENYDIRL